ncbi:MAG: DNA polymerase III subunit alpha, partial [Deltaproteobacteria bacterium]|nr:DNA polymerase III subunit alpha [Deltaproteobacteria bacterium]
VALYRPGPLQSGMVDDFINRKHKKTAIVYEVPQLKDILENTYGVMVYQEQGMEIAKVLAGYTPGDADVLRKAMGKKSAEEMTIQRQKFLEGAKKNKIDPKKAEKIYDLMAKFAGYGFNKSHSAAYALISFQTAYLKAHYNIEFMAALLGSDMGNTDQVVKYINECKDTGIAVDPPDVNESSMEFKVSGNRIRFALAAVKNVGGAAIQEMLRVREEEGKFTSLLDFLSRMDSRKVNKKVIESLIKCGAFDFTKEKRAQLMAELDPSMDAAQAVQRDREAGQSSMFDVFGTGSSAKPTAAASVNAPRVAEWSDKELLSYEKETLGFYLSSHPLAGYKRELDLYAIHIDSLIEKNNEDEVTIGGIITALKEINTKKGDRMGFVTIEDLTGSVEAVIFSDLYKKVRDLVSGDHALLFSGKLDKEEDEVKLIAFDIIPIEEAGTADKKLKARNTHIHAPVTGLTGEKLAELKKIIQENPGSSQVILQLIYPDNGRVIIGVNDGLRMSPLDAAVTRIKELIDGAEVEIV